MAVIEESAHLRDRTNLAKIGQVIAAGWARLTAHARPAPPTLKGVSDHLARDIGLSAAELEALRHEWPSETQHHPRG